MQGALVLEGAGLKRSRRRGTAVQALAELWGALGRTGILGGFVGGPSKQAVGWWECENLRNRGAISFRKVLVTNC